MSPQIELEVHSVAPDEPNLRLYATLSQIFSIWLNPFHVLPVMLTTILDLTTDPGDKNLTNGDKSFYYITMQDDLYQPTEYIKFVLPHAFVMFICIIGDFLLSWVDEKGYIPNFLLQGGNPVYDIDRKVSEIESES
ncbi:uncharacterized protein ATNIH1004_002209 [Aspergillus tanneri]|uniref:SigF-like NTF2-like domain-containing protein n=1 Tax=Aspergillus tanneri TaxID=1220188 RepID=A0A5M9MRL3_9EURO|nr:uncharacterized protein ATNIH1004_002209 [Aspergillus tanneri]KAA8649538.1 hypothetical protein ATNIH1004_002209 [Aspergillus tanneri]